jgi:hypothetical protein
MKQCRFIHVFMYENKIIHLKTILQINKFILYLNFSNQTLFYYLRIYFFNHEILPKHNLNKF